MTDADARMYRGAGIYSHVSGLIRERLHWLRYPPQRGPDDVQGDARTGACIQAYAVDWPTTDIMR